MATPTLILGANNWAIEEDNILGYALGSSSNQYLPREISFTRGSDATYTDSTGIIKQACWNLLQQSETFTNAYWTKLNATISADTTTDPSGTTTADSIIESSTNGIQEIYRTPAPTVAGTYTYSVYVKNFSGTRFLNLSASAIASSDYVSVRFSPSTESLSSVNVSGSFSNGSAFYTAIGNGWYRVVLTFTTTLPPVPQVALSTDGLNGNVGGYGVQTYTGNGTSGLFIWGAQLVQGSDALGYLRTTDRLNMPRVDSSTGTKAFLVEPQRTNLLLNSVFDGTGSTPTSWSRPGGTGSSLLTASTLGSGVQACSQSATAQRPFLQQDYTVAINTTYTFSMYIESISGTINFNNVMYLTNLPAGATTAYYLNNNLVDEGSQAQVGRLSIRVTIGAASSLVAVRCGIGTISNSTATILFSRPQFEVGSYQTTYIPTQATTVTRVADSVSKTGISSLIGQSEGALFVEFNSSFLESYTQRILTLSDGTNTNVIGFQLSSANQLIFYVESGGVNQVAITKSSPSITLGSNVKIAAAYANNDFVFYVNGTQVGTDTVGSVPATSQLRFSEGNGTSFYYGQIKQVVLYTSRVSNSELAALTTL